MLARCIALAPRRGNRGCLSPPATSLRPFRKLQGFPGISHHRFQLFHTSPPLSRAPGQQDGLMQQVPGPQKDLGTWQGEAGLPTGCHVMAQSHRHNVTPSKAPRERGAAAHPTPCPAPGRGTSSRHGTSHEPREETAKRRQQRAVKRKHTGKRERFQSRLSLPMLLGDTWNKRRGTFQAGGDL